MPFMWASTPKRAVVAQRSCWPPLNLRDAVTHKAAVLIRLSSVLSQRHPVALADCSDRIGMLHLPTLLYLYPLIIHHSPSDIAVVDHDHRLEAMEQRVRTYNRK